MARRASCVSSHVSFWLAFHVAQLCFLTFLSPQTCRAYDLYDDAFDITRYLSTNTRYEYSLKNYGGADGSLPAPPAECRPVHVNLLVRHGTREPTKKRMVQVDELSRRLLKEISPLSQNRKNGINPLEAKEKTDEPAVTPQNGSNRDEKKTHRCGRHGGKLPQWLLSWDSPWVERNHGGSLAPVGEQELYEMGKRFRRRFSELLDQGYDPAAHPLIATKVSRTSSSAVAFGMGLLEGQGSLGKCGLKPFAIKTEDAGPVSTLRFHEVCDAYKVVKKVIKKAVKAELQSVYVKIAESFSHCEETEMAFMTAEGVEALWQLCKQQATLEGIFDQACALFSEEQAALLEWADDVETFKTRAYGTAVNYRMAVPLVHDMLQAMDVIMAHTKEGRSGFVQRAHLRFAHAETVIPLTCLLGLFLENATYLQDVKEGRPLVPPPPPPAKREWHGGRVAPYASNLALVLYHCPAAPAAMLDGPQDVTQIGKQVGTPGGEGVNDGLLADEFRVLALHNEKPVIMPACGEDMFCPFKRFKEEVVGDHMKHTWEMTCMCQVRRSASAVGYFFKVLGGLRDLGKEIFRYSPMEKRQRNGIHAQAENDEL